jgi:serine/threonine protein kinase
MPGLEGKRFGPYTLQALLGQGGMSEVYLAFDERHRCEVAVKILSGNNPEYLERFRREAEAVDTLHHPHILPAYDYDDCDPWHYLVMPYVSGGTLRGRLTRGPLAPADAGRILDQIASALQYAHDHGILHRDIKPSNILFENRQHAYLADFGLAKILDDSLEITHTGTLMGTPEFMAPDLANGPATSLSDVYALGLVLYQMVTGHLPFLGSNSIEVYWKQLRELPLPPSHHNPALTLAIDRVVLRSLAKDPQRRYQSALALAEAYQLALQEVQMGNDEDILEVEISEIDEIVREGSATATRTDEIPISNSPLSGQEYLKRKNKRRRFVRVTDYALVQESKLRRIGTSGHAIQLARAREARLRGRRRKP